MLGNKTTKSGKIDPELGQIYSSKQALVAMETCSAFSA